MDSIKALHIIFMVTWFAGLFYMFRLYVYHSEAFGKDELERSILIKQYKLMEWRLWYIITWPSSVLTVGFGTALLVMNPGYLTQPWMHVKLLFVTLLIVYQLYGQRLFRDYYFDRKQHKSSVMRMLNEVSTLILISVVFLVVRKDEISWIYGVLSILGIAVIMMFAIRAYASIRKRNNS